MANKVGSIMARHNNANVEVAGIYDSKQTSKRVSTMNAGDDVCCLHFDATNGFVDDANNTYWGIADSDTANYEINSEGVFTALDGSTSTGVRAATPSIFNIGSTDFTIDGYYYIDESKLTSTSVQFWYFGNGSHNAKTGICLALGFVKSGTNGSNSYIGVTYGRLKTNNGTYAPANAGIFYFDCATLFNRWFHLACTYQMSTSELKIFLDGEPKVAKGLASYSNRVFSPAVAVGVGTVTNVANSAGLSCSMFRYCEFLRWTETFVPPQINFEGVDVNVTGNLPIRHNNQTYYAPLISDANYKSSPCIAVRHNNQTYYTVK